MIKSRSTKIGDWIIVGICCVLIFVCLVPLLNVLARSVSSTEYLIRNEVLLWPKGFNLDAYTTVLGDQKYTHSLVFTAGLTVVCTLISMAMTVMCAYPLIMTSCAAAASSTASCSLPCISAPVPFRTICFCAIWACWTPCGCSLFPTA